MTPPAEPVRPWFDSRHPASEDAAGGFVLREPTPEQRAEAAQFAARLPGLVLRWDGMSGSVRWMAAPPGLMLAAPAGVAPAHAARGFLQVRTRLLGVSLQEIADLELSSVVTAPEGDVHVHFLQRAGALEVFHGGALVNFDPQGAVLSAGVHLYAGAASASTSPLLPAAAAMQIAQRDVYPLVPFAATILSAQPDGERRTLAEGTGFADPPQARLVLFPLRDGTRLAWEVRIAEPTRETDYLLLVDAVDGSILFRENHTLYASARVLNASAPDPQTEELAPAQHELLPIPASTAQSPGGWLSGAGTTLTGNNANSHFQYYTAAGPAEPSAIYDYHFNTLSGAVTNAWWWANDAHDRFRALGFNEAAGNFQDDNFGLGGIGGDAMKVTHFELGDRNNAFNNTDPDGQHASINFFWVDCRSCGDHDGYPENGGERSPGFMREVVFHEYTHGVSTRMVGGPAIANCLYGRQSGAMGEGWSDLFAASFLDDPQVGQYFFEGPGWMRDARNDLTYSDLCKIYDRGGCEVHADGMIWLATLWDLRRSMIELDPVNGLDQFHRIVVKGLANTVCFPDFLDARDGILGADATLYGSVHQSVIWNVFAARRMGNTASTTGENDSAPITSTSVPAGMSCSAPAAPTGLTAVPEGTNAIRLGYLATGAAAVEVYREELGNPLDTRTRVGSTTSGTTYLDTGVQGGKGYRYHVAAIGSAGITCRSADSATADASAAGTCQAFPLFDPNLQVADGPASCTLTLTWSAATPGCPASSQGIVYNVYRASAPGFEPSERLLIGRTTATTLQDAPPQVTAGNAAFYYLVTAQHGTLADPPDHRAHGAAQVLRWVPRVPAIARTSALDWNFDGGSSGWTTDNTANPSGAWTLASSTPATRYADLPFTPPLPAGGAGQSWFTGQGNGSVAANDCDGENKLISPVFDGTAGRTILSFDYWSNVPGRPSSGGLQLQVSNGTTTVAFQDIAARTTQTFDTPTDRGWQRAEVDLSKLVPPTASMRVTIVSIPGGNLSEFGVDNVRVAQATTCGASSLTVSAVGVDDTPSGWGNGNGVLEAGETARLLVTLTNNGSVEAATPSGILTPRSSGVIVHESQSTFPTIAASGGVGASSGGFTVTVPSDFACGATLVFDFKLVDAAGTVSYASANLEGGRAQSAVVFEDTFATDKGWSAGGASLGQGVWQRGDPVGTLDGANQANPEFDSPNDADSFCYVTENGAPGGSVSANDIDSPSGVYPWLDSPAFDLTGYKRAQLSYDVWYYDNSSTRSYWEDYGEVQAYINDGTQNWFDWLDEGDKTGGWKPVSYALVLPMVANTHVFVYGYDPDGSRCGGCQNDIVEMGLDNVKVTGSRQVCDPAGSTHPPRNVTTLSVARGSQLVLSWSAPTADASHDPAAFYETWAASNPGGPYSRLGTTTTTTSEAAPDLQTRFFSIAAVNAAGSTGYLPSP